MHLIVHLNILINSLRSIQLRQEKNMKNIPTKIKPKYDAIEAIITQYADQYLNEEYKELCIKALAKLSRKRPSPLESGKDKTWAAGIIYAIGSANFIFDKSQQIHMTADELVAPLDISRKTASAKASTIKKMLKIDCFNTEWVLPSKIDSNPMAWLIQVNGLIMDARYTPLEIQVEAYNKGLIPYIPALKNSSEQ